MLWAGWATGVAIAGKQQMEGMPPLDMGNFLNYCNQLPAQGPRSSANQEGHGRPGLVGAGGRPGRPAMATADGREVKLGGCSQEKGRPTGPTDQQKPTGLLLPC